MHEVPRFERGQGRRSTRALAVMRKVMAMLSIATARRSGLLTSIVVALRFFLLTQLWLVQRWWPRSRHTPLRRLRSPVGVERGPRGHFSSWRSRCRCTPLTTGSAA